MQSISHKIATPDEFVSIAAHELRTPMTVIRSYLWLCLFRPPCQLPKAISPQLHAAYLATERLLELVKELLIISQLEAGKIASKLETHQLHKVITQILRELNYQAQEKQVTFAFKNQTTDSSCRIDRTKISETLQNLVSNAIKFSPIHGVVLITLSVDGGNFVVSVADQGPGIAQADQGQLFQKFGVIRNSYQTSAEQATGLGLYIAQQFAQLHHGQITFSSEEGKGATFTLKLPRTTSS